MAPIMSEATARPAEETLRVHQANERTMLAWIRTGIALMAFGFAIERFALFMRQIAAFSPLSPPAPSLGSSWVGASLVALGMLTNLLATVRYAQVRRAIERGYVGAPHPALVYALGITATLIGLAMTALLARALGEH
jgi:inner membrane protein YidH